MPLFYHPDLPAIIGKAALRQYVESRALFSEKHGRVQDSFCPLQSFFDHRFQFNKRSQRFIRMHNETLSVVAMCVSNPDCSPVGINR